MKSIYIILSFVFASTVVFSQSKATQSADKLFLKYEYVKAAEAYLKLVDNGKKDKYIYKQLADCYYAIFKPESAVIYYGKATEDKQDSETYYRYAQMLKASGKYEEANVQMKKFAAMEPNDLRAKAFNEDPNYIPRLLDQNKLYNLKTLEINSEKSDFGAILHDNTLYFTSARKASGKTYGWNNEPFLDLYTATYNADGSLSNILPIDELNSVYHDGFLTISQDGNTAYFTSDGFREKSFVKDKSNKIKKSSNYIFRATKTEAKWGNITAVPFSNSAYSTSNPSLSKDGKTLYFSSNMPGSIGGVDIWKVAINEDGSYGTPENMGEKVNTEGNESFPFILNNNLLYFASSGRQGLGGLDVYVINLDADTAVKNVGKPVNSEKDDFAFSFNTAKNIGFFSSNRGGNDDLYGALPLCKLDVITIVSNLKTGEIQAEARVAILDDKKNIIATQTTNAKGIVSFQVECGKTYSVQVAKDGFESNTFEVAKTDKADTKTINAGLEPIDVIITDTQVVLKSIFFEFDKSNITQEGAFELDKLVQVMKNNPKLVIRSKSHTDTQGTDKYNMELSERRAQSTVQYIISKGIDPKRISGKGCGETQLRISCGDNCTEEQHAINRRSEFLIVK